MSAATPERKPMTEEISGLIERVTFHNDESGFCVLRVNTQGHREEMTVVGSIEYGHGSGKRPCRGLHHVMLGLSWPWLRALNASLF